MVSLILVSHSQKITDGLKEMVEEMAHDQKKLTIYSCGGSDGRIGTDPTKIMEAIEASSESEYIYLIGDIGSGLISIDAAIDLVDESLKEKCHVISGPLVEGAFVSAVTLMNDSNPESIKQQIKEVINSY